MLQQVNVCLKQFRVTLEASLETAEERGLRRWEASRRALSILVHSRLLPLLRERALSSMREKCSQGFPIRMHPADMRSPERGLAMSQAPLEYVEPQPGDRILVLTVVLPVLGVQRAPSLAWRKK